MRLCPSKARAQVQSLVGELRSHMPHSMAKKKKRNKKEERKEGRKEDICGQLKYN